MLLKAPSALSFPTEAAAAARARALAPASSSLSSVLKLSLTRRRDRPSLVTMATGEAAGRALSGVVFEPFEEVKKELSLVPTSHDQSLARQKYDDDCEAAINEQIKFLLPFFLLRFLVLALFALSHAISSLDLSDRKQEDVSEVPSCGALEKFVEYTASYVYHSLFAYFDRDNVALRGLAKFFKESSEEEREHAEKLMKYQNKRGGKVKLLSILSPLSEFDHDEKGDALYAMELTLALEKLVNEKLLNLHAVATKSNDVQMSEYIESEFLTEQMEAIKKIAEYVAQLRRVGQGHGVWHFDQMLLDEGDAAV
ncbi:hypothetical protein Taro_015974 [Colocasia esculenta]|uniref:Ferritin n=1 Tax=Colocasia esculenta TaxID=4460 RepID=A0A843UML9_COLES|nr:hypothetical protein [Colocasia esculenta]